MTLKNKLKVKIAQRVVIDYIALRDLNELVNMKRCISG